MRGPERARRVALGVLVVGVVMSATGCRLAHDMVEVDAAAPGERVVALTFDDGPHPVHTPMLLDVLRRHDVRATFFVTGSQAARYPWILDRIVREGHRVGNHTWNHVRLSQTPDHVAAAEIGWTQAWLAWRGITSRCVRSPYWAHDERVDGLIRAYADNSYSMKWSIDTHDWRGVPARSIADTVVAQLHPGAVVLMHDGGGNRSQTVAGVDQMIGRIRAAGYSIRPVC
jgi:peptidoglycan/xylan/chitin deacetylase (PgdA/CDA1 family)